MGDEDDDLDQYAQLEAEDTLEERGLADILDEGYSPPERPWVLDGVGLTAREEFEGETLDERLARELPDGELDDDGDGLGDSVDTDGELLDDEVGNVRSGRLVDADSGAVIDTDKDLFAVDAGIDGAGASAEEAAVHVVDGDV